MRFGKAVLVLVGAVATLGALVASASARNLSISSQTLRALFSAVTFDGAFGKIVCEVQVEGSFHARTVPKVVGSLVGYITEARILRCAENTATILRETLPWHVRYLSFAGTLPNISSIRAIIVGAAFNIMEPAFTCLARSTAERPQVIVMNREVVTGVVSNAEVGGTIPSTCGVEGTFRSNRAPVTTLNSTTRITITLI